MVILLSIFAFYFCACFIQCVCASCSSSCVIDLFHMSCVSCFVLMKGHSFIWFVLLFIFVLSACFIQCVCASYSSSCLIYLFHMSCFSCFVLLYGHSLSFFLLFNLVLLCLYSVCRCVILFFLCNVYISCLVFLDLCLCAVILLFSF